MYFIFNCLYVSMTVCMWVRVPIMQDSDTRFPGGAMVISNFCGWHRCLEWSGFSVSAVRVSWLWIALQFSVSGVFLVHVAIHFKLYRQLSCVCIFSSGTRKSNNLKCLRFVHVGGWGAWNEWFWADNEYRILSRGCCLLSDISHLCCKWGFLNHHCYKERGHLVSPSCSAPK